MIVLSKADLVFFSQNIRADDSFIAACAVTGSMGQTQTMFDCDNSLFRDVWNTVAELTINKTKIMRQIIWERPFIHV